MDQKKIDCGEIFANCISNNYIVVAVLSAVVFCLIYGVRVLDPTYTDWLMAGGDLSQHYLGWTAYRASSWHFPIGMVDTLAYPILTSIIFTDSIPLFAVLFKLLSPILPNEFQYFGFWGIMCFVLQGILAARIIKNFTENKAVITMSSILFALMPIMIQRMYGHSALAGQWVLIFGLELIFAHKKYEKSKRIYVMVGLMGMLSVFIHMYFVLMNGIILLGICFIDILGCQRLKRSGIILLEYLASVVMATWILGGFCGGVSARSGGLGVYSSNLNSLFNPQGWSRIFKDLSLYGKGQYEGFGYLGGGILFLVVIACVSDGKLWLCLKKYWKEIIVLASISGVSMMIALSPIITGGECAILQMQLPQWIINIWSVFRASGRVIWVVVYIIIFSSLIIIIKTMSKNKTVVVLAVALIIQIYDISDVLKMKYEHFSQIQEQELLLKETNFWNYIAKDTQIRHIVYLSDVERAMMYSITDWAMQNEKTVNDFYFARSIDDKVSNSKADALGELSEDTLFIFKEDKFENILDYDLYYYKIDGLIIGYSKKIIGYEEMLDRLIWNFGDNIALSKNGGQDTQNGRELYSGGLSYGPYWRVPKGNYFITIEGEGLQEGVGVTIYSKRGAMNHNFEIISKNESEIRISIFLDKDVEDLEICIKNNLADTVLIKNMQLTVCR